MATSEYRVIELADGTFAVEAWHGSGMLLFERLGFRLLARRPKPGSRLLRQEAHPITSTKRH